MYMPILKKLDLIAVLVIILLPLQADANCKNANELVGEWGNENPDMKGYSYKEDRLRITFEYNWDYDEYIGRISQLPENMRKLGFKLGDIFIDLKKKDGGQQVWDGTLHRRNYSGPRPMEIRVKLTSGGQQFLNMLTIYRQERNGDYVSFSQMFCAE